MFFSSPANSIDLHIALLEELRCQTFLTPIPNSAVGENILSKRAMRVLPLPDVGFWLQDLEVPIYRYNKSYSEACHDPFVVLHSSGSTGVPKVLVLTNGTVAAVDSYQIIPSLGGNPWHGLHWKGKRVFQSLPWFFAAGLFFSLTSAIYNDFIPVIVPEAPKITPELANGVHVHGNVEAGLFAPTTLVEIAKVPAYIENLQLLKFVTYGGGPLSCESARLICAKTRVSAAYGSTEAGYLPTEMSEPEDWNYFKFSPQLGHRFHDFGDGLFELVIHRSTELKLFQGIFYTFPDLQEYSMRDLFLKHPTKEGWWRHCGRSDDILVFSDARKLNPVVMEAEIELHPSIRSATICGHGKAQPAMLIEPTTYPKNQEEKKRLIEDIWATIFPVVEKGPASGKIIKELVIITPAEKPVPRSAGKDTIMRRKMADLYQEEIDQAYDAIA